MCIYIYIYTYIILYVYVHTYMHTYIHTYIFMYTCVYIYIYIYIYNREESLRPAPPKCRLEMSSLARDILCAGAEVWHISYDVI